MKKIEVRDIVLCALFAALSAVLSQVIIPIGPAPVNFTHFSIFTAAGLLGAKRGTVSQIIFVLLGVAGVPVFSEFSGGIGVLLGPTGGFIVGYILCAFAAGLIIDRWGRSIKVLIPAILVGWVVTYACGIPWFMHIVGMGFYESAVYMAQFIPGDILKTVLAVIIVNRVYPVFVKKEN